MTTMTVTDIDAVRVDRTIGTVVKILARARGESVKAAGAAIGLSYSAINERLVGKRHFLAYEVAALARHFGVDPTVFFTDPLRRFQTVERSPHGEDELGHGSRILRLAVAA
jgi:hypothetical protein